MAGYKTYITLAVTALFLIASFMGIDIGIDKEHAEIIFAGLITIALAFIRKGSTTDAASSTQATVQALTNSVAKGDQAAATVGTANVTPVKPAVPVDLPR